MKRVRNRPLTPRLSSTSLPWPVDWAALFGVEKEKQGESEAGRGESEGQGAALSGGLPVALGTGADGSSSAARSPQPAAFSAVPASLPTLHAPLILEIGFGYGHFLKHLSATYPDALIVGVEIANECLEHVDFLLNRGDMPNVRIIFARAETALHHLFQPASIDQIHVNFPDPWFKSRHERRRLMQRSNIDAMVSRLKPGGMLYLATDIRDYAEMSDEALRETHGLVNTLGAAWSSEPLPGRIVTKYERKALDVGRPCHYFAYRRDDTPVPFIPVLTEADMPHLTLSLPLTADEIAARFEGFEAKAAAREPANTGTNISVNASQVFTGRNTVLIEAYVVEPTIQQHVGIFVAPIREKPGEYTIGLSTIGSPRPTDGLHFAVRKTADWLLTIHPDAKITGDKARTGFVEVEQKSATEDTEHTESTEQD